MTKERLSKESWVAAGFRALADQGPSAIQINALAKTLGATKGSFYWHFASLADFKAAMLDLWHAKAAIEVMEQVEQLESPQAKLDALLTEAARSAPEEYGGRKIQPAMRAWALSDADVAASLANLDKMRLGFIETLLSELGLHNAALAQLIYGAYIGLDDLDSKGRADIFAGLGELAKLVRSQA